MAVNQRRDLLPLHFAELVPMHGSKSLTAQRRRKFLEAAPRDEDGDEDEDGAYGSIRDTPPSVGRR